MKALLRMGLLFIREDEKEKGIIRLRSKQYLAELFDVVPNYKIRYQKVLDNNFSNIEHYIKAIAIHESKKSQERIIIEKLLEKKFESESLSNIKQNNARIYRKEKRKIKKNIDTILAKSQKAFNPFSNENFYNPYTTLSRRGIARLFGKKSAKSGSNSVKKLKSMNLIYQDDSVYKFMFKCSWDEFVSCHTQSDIFLTYKQGKCYARLSNMVSVMI